MPTEAHMLDESREALQGVRRSLIELYAAVGADPETPQDVARRFSLHRNLTWKLSRVMGAADPFSSLAHLPGEQGLALALDAFAKAGAPPEAVEPVRAALRQFVEVVDRHAGDRDQFELTLESMGLFARQEGPESGREAAFRGNSMIWGVQTRVRSSTVFIAPASSDRVDFVQIGGLIGFRRLRASVRWRLFRAQVYDDKGGVLTTQGPEELEPKNNGDVPMVLREFCSPNMPAIEIVTGPDGREFLLPGGPVGKQSQFDYFSGYVARGLPMYADPNNTYGSVAAPITVPAERLIFDVIFHRDLARTIAPEALLYGFPHGGIDSPAAQTVQNLLPMKPDIVEVAGSPPAVATAHIPRYSQLVARVFERMNWTPGEFRGLRAQMLYPPMSSRVVLRWVLPQRPAPAQD